MDQHARHSAYELSHVPASQLQFPIQHAHPTQSSNPQIPVQDPAVTQSRMEESLKRSVTLVFWYKAGCDPLRLHQEIATFPLFQLSQLTQLVNDLGLSATTYVDAYNPLSSTWEQQTISAVRMIESEQRLLFRMRKSLLDGLADNDCPGVDHEIGLQSRTTKSASSIIVSLNASLKRPSSNSDSYTPPNKYYRSDDYNGTQRGYDSAPANESSVYPQSLSIPKPSPNDTIHYIQSPPSQIARTSSLTPGLSTPSSSASSPSEPTIPYHPHPPLKRWPNDYTVSEIAAGFRRMDGMIAAQPTLTQKSTFQTVFGCRYIKSTVCRHRAVWKRADPALKDAYERMGSDERAVWGEFVKKAEGKLSNVHGNGSGNGHANGNISQRSSLDATTPQMQHHSQPQAAGLVPGMHTQVGPTSVNMGMLAHGLPHVGLGAEPDKSEPVMASLMPPSHSVPNGGLHSGRVSANNHDPSGYLQQSAPLNAQNT
ncbi:unnamed protein product [Somion occarium]|uniref:Uncharacterized protein n=1 Tax=Somion occarium TaxID=3059160 RepID=A0ABP1D1X8_9APHY